MAGKKFDELMERLEEIVDNLEKGDLSLENSLKSFEEGMKLVHVCSKKLEEAERKVTLLVKEADEGYIQKPFETEDKDDI